MANSNRPTGLSPVGMITGAPYNGQARQYSIAAAYNVALYIGDPVISSGTADDKGVQGIALAAATGPIRGVIVGLSDQPFSTSAAGTINANITYRPAAAQSTVWYAMVVDDPNVVFEVQEIGTGTPLTAAACGLNANLELAAGNGFVSGWMVGNDDEGTTSTLQVRLLGLAQRSDNAFGQYAKWNVLINAHELRIGSDGL
jgi:hypothetical protein